MAHIVVFPTSIMAGSDGNVLVSGEARLSTGGDSVSWEVNIAYTAQVATYNSAMINAAIDAAENAGHTIGPLDNRTLLAGAVGL